MAEIATNQYLVDAGWVQAHANDGNVVLIDTRPVADYRRGHIAGARHFDPFPFHHRDTSEAGLRIFCDQLTWIFSTLGLGGKETVVCYEDNSGMRATRVAWALEYMGHPAVRILDGGLQVASMELVMTAPRITPTHFVTATRDATIASYEYIRERLGRPGYQIFDVRTEEEYFGERVRARYGGAVPGAIHREWVHNLDDRGRFKPASQLRAEFESLGLRPENEIIPYCQGAYRSANAYVALRMAGYSKVRNYLGSWAEWGNYDDLPIDRPRRKPAKA